MMTTIYSSESSDYKIKIYSLNLLVQTALNFKLQKMKANSLASKA